MSDSSFIGQSKLSFKEGEVVYRKGEMAQQMYVILSGRVRMYVGLEPQGEWAEELNKGDFFGEGSLLEPIPRFHTAVALEDVEVVAISRGTFLRMIKQNPEVSVKMMQRLAQRNRELAAKVEEGSSRGYRSHGVDSAASLVSLLPGGGERGRQRHLHQGRPPGAGGHPGAQARRPGGVRHGRPVFREARMSSMKVEVWRDEHGVTWELVQLALDEVGGTCIIREGFNSLDRADGDMREGVEVIARFGDVEDARAFLESEGFSPM